MAKKKPKTKRKPRVSEALTERRVGELLRIRLDGAEWWDICEFVREKEQEEGSAWHLAEGASPLSSSQIRRLLARADGEIQCSHVRSRRILRRRHLAQRRNMYAKAMLAGDVRTALACTRDEAELQGLYPAKRTELTGKNGKPLQAKVTHEHKDQLPPEEAIRILLASLARGPAAAGAGAGAQVRQDGLPEPVDTAQPAPQAGRVPPA